MPIPEGPGGPGAMQPASRIYTSIRGQADTHSTLVEIDLRLTRRSDRLDAIKLLRVLLMGRNGEVAFAGRERRKELDGLLRRFLRIYDSPKVTTVAQELGIGAITGRPEHLNLDWFGREDENWWPDLGGTDFEDKIGETLLKYLEDSMNIVPNASPDPQTWRWHLPNDPNGGWKADLENQTPDNRAIAPIRFEWEVAVGNKILDVQIVTDNGQQVFRIKTPWPRDLNGLQVY